MYENFACEYFTCEGVVCYAGLYIFLFYVIIHVGIYSGIYPLVLLLGGDDMGNIVSNRGNNLGRRDISRHRNRGGIDRNTGQVDRSPVGSGPVGRMPVGRRPVGRRPVGHSDWVKSNGRNIGKDISSDIDGLLVKDIKGKDTIFRRIFGKIFRRKEKVVLVEIGSIGDYDKDIENIGRKKEPIDDVLDADNIIVGNPDKIMVEHPDKTIDDGLQVSLGDNSDYGIMVSREDFDMSECTEKVKASKYATIITWIKRIIKWLRLQKIVCRMLCSFELWSRGVVPNVDNDIVEVVVRKIVEAIKEVLDIECELIEQ